MNEYSVYLSELYKTDPDLAWDLVKQWAINCNTKPPDDRFWDRGPLGFMKYKEKVIYNIKHR